MGACFFFCFFEGLFIMLREKLFFCCFLVVLVTSNF